MSPSPLSYAADEDGDDSELDGNVSDEEVVPLKLHESLPLGSVDVNNAYKMTSSAKRRARKKKLEAEWENRRDQASENLPPIPLDAKGEARHAKTRRGGRKLRQRKDRATLRRLILKNQEATQCADSPSRNPARANAGDDDEWSEDGASRILDCSPDLGDEDEVDALGVLEAMEETEVDTVPPSTNTNSVRGQPDMSIAEAKSYVDR